MFQARFSKECEESKLITDRQHIQDDNLSLSQLFSRALIHPRYDSPNATVITPLILSSDDAVEAADIVIEGRVS